MKRLVMALAAAALTGQSGLAFAQQDSRCEPIAERALDESNDVIKRVTPYVSPKEAAWRAGQACYLVKNAVDNLFLLKCDADLISLMQQALKIARDTLDSTNQKLSTNGRCIAGGGY